MFYEVAKWYGLIVGFKDGEVYCFGKFCTSASRLTISGGLKKPADLRDLSARVQEFSVANCRGREVTGLGVVFSIGFDLHLVNY
nr:hypothetical protein [Pedobacter sp. ASV19]